MCVVIDAYGIAAPADVDEVTANATPYIEHIPKLETLHVHPVRSLHIEQAFPPGIILQQAKGVFFLLRAHKSEARSQKPEVRSQKKERDYLWTRIEIIKSFANNILASGL
jgi:hypothetical protein